MQRKLAAGVWAGLLLAIASVPARAQISAQAFISEQQLAPGNYEYSLTLSNTGSTPIGTFWVGWIPLYDMLDVIPGNVRSPGGWTGADAGDYFGVGSVQWTTTSGLQPGESLSGFSFDTSESDIMTGTSYFNLPKDTSYVYIGAPETDPGMSLTPTIVPTPEPASLSLLLLPAAALLIRRKRA